MTKLNADMKAGTDAATATDVQVNHVNQTIAKPRVGGALLSNGDMNLLLNKLLAEMRHQDPYLAYRPTEEQMDKLRLVVWQWVIDRWQ